MNLTDLSIKISDSPLSIQNIVHTVSAPEIGGIDVFIGTVRNHALERDVTHLIFESYEPMAIKEMQKIAVRAITEFECRKVAIWHRVGKLAIGEIAVLIAVGADHRGAAFDACRFCIDTLKETVPIWKKEYFTDGSHWVSAYP